MERFDKQGLNIEVTVALVRKLLHRGARAAIAKILAKAYPVDVARMLAMLKGYERVQTFSILLNDCQSSQTAAVISEMETSDSVPLLENLEPQQIAQLVSEMPADDATLLTSRLPDELATKVMALMATETAADVRELLEHEERTAGRIMTPDFFALEEEVTVSEAITALQRRSDELEMILYVYVVDKRNHLIGVVSLRRLLTTPSSTQLKKIMTPKTLSARTDTAQQEVARLVAEYNLLALPIVDNEGKLVGMVTVDDVLDVVQEEATEDLLALAGVAAEEQMSTSAKRSLQLRAPWLMMNLGTAFIASFVISRFDATITALPLLSFFMCVPMGMGGNAATQAVTIVVRGLALNQLTTLSRAIRKELAVGLGIGIINGILAGIIVAFFSRKMLLGIVITLSMIINLVVAGLAGLLIPVALKRIGADPALSSSVFVTTCTDVVGSASFLGIATLLLKYLM